ncbi:MAG: ribokinase [Anaerolineae bacterium]|nr:ribokinase [Anaerolineae bacterium]
MSIVVFGSINMDIITYVPRLPAPGETLFGHSYVTAPGGKGSNQAGAAGKLGNPTAFIGRIGKDAFGPEVRGILAAQGADVSGLMVDEAHGTGIAVISVDDRAENCIIVISGANMAIDETDVQRALPYLDRAKVLLLQMEVPLEANISVAKAARTRGVKVVFDPAPARPLPDDFYPFIDVITPNEGETEVLTGIRPATIAEASQAADILLGRGVGTAVIKLGAQGAYFKTAGGEGFVPSFIVDAIDTVAAGDAFNGGLATAIAEGKDIAEALRWGAASGGLSTTKSGALPSMPTRAEFDRLLREGKQRQ